MQCLICILRHYHIRQFAHHAATKILANQFGLLVCLRHNIRAGVVGPVPGKLSNKDLLVAASAHTHHSSS
jgi:hypothetical protein